MTRQAKQTPEEKKESRKAKAPQKKKPAETGVWPCKINGCNKQFAREADLKRHQRTTKLHSVPGFACPQCDATFTRTDALRRHQKSRHNGVIIEPAESDKKKGGEEDAHSSGSKSNSRSTSPKSKDKEPSSNVVAPTVSPPGPPGPPPGGPQSYYPYIFPVFPPPPPGMIMEGYPPPPPGIGLPTSATRLHQANWPPPPPWVTDGSQPPMGAMAYHQVGPHPGYYPPPYYRPGMMPPHAGPPPHHLHPEFMAQSQMQNGIPHSPHGESSRTGTPAMGSIQNNVDPQLSQGSSSSNHDMAVDHSQGEGKADSVAPVIDPSLDMSPATSNTNADAKSVSFEITQAAMEAVLKSAERESSLAEASSRASAAPDTGGSPPMPGDHPPQPERGSSHGSNHAPNSGMGDADGEGEGASVARELGSPVDTKPQMTHMVSYDGSPPHSHPLERPAEMEHMLTEDGEPMLNPAELLTQESLASPPPS
ncbi:hypothetical protein BV22DRAFT_765606 [Leucogyrophana mollusca]|uniref:Uncharacterized protein n=1 Tax=Leucogyrophana mollusca TaxID=85980 RepID=A0ACB8B5I8_9AGAM|nr:hypothetical protein BV22DRAFT_765606 [Leucogyrophana mollusca]